MHSRGIDTNQQHRGFTVAELIVVISLAAIMLGTLLPGVSAMRNMGRTKTAINTIGVAIPAAKAYASAKKADLQATGNPAYAGFTYSGVAILFTPAGELRLVENRQDAMNSANPPRYLEENNMNGYGDIPGRDYIKFPRDVGVVGMTRNSSGPPLLLTPPFALRFNQDGYLIAGQPSTPERAVYYDHDSDGAYETVTRGAGYDPDAWDPSVTTLIQNAGRYPLPFSEMETVIGVVVYSKSELRAAGHNQRASSVTGNPINDNARRWLLDPDNNPATDDGNGEIILFGRYTGAMARR